MSDHTEGPWEIHRQPCEILVQGGGVTIATVRPYDMDHAGTRDADANLLAAAPDMLQALEELLAEAEAHDFHNARSFGFQLAEDAYRKAKGLEPIPRFPSVGQRGVW